MPRTVAYGLPLKQFQRVGPAEVAYFEEGPADAPPAIFLHGITTHSVLWRKVLKELRDVVHGFALDLMGLGDTIVSPYEDFSMPAQADMVLEFMERLGISSAALVAHDHGGAVAQILAASHPERVSHLVLVDTVSQDHWPIPLVRQVIRLARLPGTAELLRAAAIVKKSPAAWRLAVGPTGYASGYYDPGVIEADLIRDYLRPFTDPDGRERARRFLLASDPRSTVEILPRLRKYDRPCRILWGADDRFLSPSWGIELTAEIPSAKFVLLPFCGHFAPDERHDLVSAHVRELVFG
jgi:2-hydroxymuconate-semialdehyde hydrolase